MEENIQTNSPTITQKHNAVISYCFLAPFMLLSRDERFNNHFVKIHARYALLIQVAFLVLITILVKSSNFSSMIIFGASWVHVLLFLCFFILLGFTAKGMYRALQGNDPKFTLRELSWSSIKNIGEVAVIEEQQKLPLILSHIPFLGTYLESRYGEFLKSGEKFGNWAFLIAAVFIWIDPSLTLLIIWITGVTFWIVYQSVLVTSGDSVRLIGSKLPGVKTCHVWIRSAFKYGKILVNHDEKIPVWSEIISEQSNIYEAGKTKLSHPKLSIPFINIPSIVHGIRTKEASVALLDAIIIDSLLLYSLYFSHTPLLMVALLASWCSYWQAKSGKGNLLPCISDISEMITGIIEWKRKKSIPQITTNSL